MTIDWRRVGYATATLAVIAIGLTTRLPLIHWPPMVGKYAGAVLWGAMVYCILRLMRPTSRLLVSAAIAMVAAALVEFSQLWHTAGLDAFRRTTIGVLLSGRYFAWADIATYALGIALAAAIDGLACKRWSERIPP